MSRKVFLSCVSKEFRPYRDMLAGDLRIPGVEVRVQEDFVLGGHTTLAKLDAYIKDCDAVIHLVGSAAGWMPEPAEVSALVQQYPEFTGRVTCLKDLQTERHSYTQWEAWFAVYHRVPCYVYQADPSASRGPEFVEDAGQKQLQEEHWRRLLALGKDRLTFRDEQHLCRQVLRSLNAILPGVWQRQCHLPYRSIGELFIGRDGFLTELRERFEKARKSGRWPNQAIQGLGGVGKTRTAVEYAWRYADDYSALLFVSGESPERLNSSLAGLAGVLKLNIDDTASDPERLRAVHDWLDGHPGWLLIIDNVDDKKAGETVASLLRRSTTGHVLITGRWSRWSKDVEPLELRVLAQADAVHFLKASTEDARPPDDEPAEVEALARDDLGCLCLALEQASAYIRDRGIGFKEYRRRWAINAKNVRAWADKAIMKYREEADVSLSIATTWQTTFDQLRLPGRGLLQILGWLAPNPLPRELFDTEKTSKALGGLCGAEDVDTEEALVELARFSLLQRAGDEEFATPGQVHRLVQLITRERQTPTEQKASLAAALSMVNAYASSQPQDVSTWPCWDPLAPHVEAVVQHADAAGVARPTARLMNDLGVFYKAKARFGEAEPLCRRALAVAEASYGPKHGTVAVYLNNLAGLLRATNRMAEAEPLYRRTVVIREAVFGPKHPSVATGLNNLAELLRATNRPAEAEPLFRRALAIGEAAHGPNHPSVANRLSNLAVLLRVTNRFAEAEPLYRRALAIDEAAKGPHHPSVAVRLNNLAELLRATNHLAEAESLIRRALAIDEAAFGPSHPTVAIRLNNLARLLRVTNRMAEAEPLYLRALTLIEAAHGPNHPTTALALNNLASLLRATNRWAQAEPLLRRALAIIEASYGPNHPSVARELNNLAGLLRETNRFAEAEPMLRRALTIDEASSGPDHPDVAIDLNNLGRLLHVTNRLAEAEPPIRRALAIDEASYGPNHPTVATRLNNLAGLLQDTTRFAEAESLARRALAIDEASYGPKHPSVAANLNHLAELLRETKRFADAEPLVRRALAIDEASLGLDHPAVARDLKNLAELLSATNRPAEAEPLVRRALAIDEASYSPKHTSVARSLDILAELLRTMDRFTEAEPLIRRALAIDEAAYGANDPDVARDLNNLAQLLCITSRRAEAEPLSRRALEILVAFTRSTGHKHLRLQKAVDIYRQILAQQEVSESEVSERLMQIGVDPAWIAIGV